MIEKKSGLPNVSVLMSCYNGSRWINEAIESVLTQTYKNFEFIIINDGSTDNTWNIIETYSVRDSRIVAINKQNTGLADTLNFGISIARGKWIARIDQDDISAPNRLYEQLNFLTNNPEVILVGTGFIEIDEFNNEIKRHNYPSNHNALQKNLVKSKKFFPHSSAFFSVEIVNKIGGYNTRIRRAEDRDLWLKFTTHGKIACIQNHLVTIRKHSNQMSLDNNGKNQFCDALATEVCYWLRLFEFKDPSTFTNFDEWKSFRNWLENRVEVLGVFDQRITWSLARSVFFNTKNKLFAIFKFFKILIQKGNITLFLWEYYFGSNLSKNLAKEWIKNKL